MVKNGKKWQNITNNCNISEMTKYGEKMKKMKKCKNMPKTGLKRPKMATFQKFCFHRFSGSKLPKKKWY